MMAKAPMPCNKDMCSCNKTVANTTADSGSRYPQIATVCTGSFDNGEKIQEQPKPVFTTPNITIQSQLSEP